MSYAKGDDRDTRTEVHRAGPIGDRHVPTFSIVGLKEIEDRPFDDLVKFQQLFVIDAMKIAGVLFDSLPGGTLDRLLVEFLQRKASHFVVNVGDPIQTRYAEAVEQVKRARGYLPDDYPTAASQVLDDILEKARLP